MKLLALGVVLAALGIPALPGQDLPDWVLQLSRVKRHARENFQHLPDYVCRETVDRFAKRPRARATEKLDTLQFEVALVGGREMLAAPGAGRFEDAEPFSHVREGTFAYGSFASTVSNLFVHDNARITRWREEKDLFRAALAYDFEISEFMSGYEVRSGFLSANTGLAGTFWVDRETMDLLRIEEHAVAIPEYIGLSDVDTTTDFARVRIGAANVLLPQSADMVIRDLNGGETRNVTRFSACRAYTSESVIHYDTPVETAPPPPKKK